MSQNMQESPRPEISGAAQSRPPKGWDPGVHTDAEIINAMKRCDLLPLDEAKQRLAIELAHNFSSLLEYMLSICGKDLQRSLAIHHLHDALYCAQQSLASNDALSSD